MWRLQSDTTLVATSVDGTKTLQPLCELLKDLACSQGLASVEIENHILSQKQRPGVPRHAFNFFFMSWRTVFAKCLQS